VLVRCRAVVDTRGQRSRMRWARGRGGEGAKRYPSAEPASGTKWQGSGGGGGGVSFSDGGPCAIDWDGPAEHTVLDRVAQHLDLEVDAVVRGVHLLMRDGRVCSQRSESRWLNGQKAVGRGGVKSSMSGGVMVTLTTQTSARGSATGNEEYAFSKEAEESAVSCVNHTRLSKERRGADTAGRHLNSS
jgi:hypothetical protein